MELMPRDTPTPTQARLLRRQKEHERAQRQAEDNRKRSGHKKAEARKVKVSQATVYAKAQATLERRTKMTTKERKAEDFLLGKRPPRPWYRYSNDNAENGSTGAFPGAHPKWDERKRRALALKLAAHLGERPIFRPKPKASFFRKIQGFLAGTFAKARPGGQD